MKSIFKNTLLVIVALSLFTACNNSGKKSGALTTNAAERVYVAPGEHDEYYACLSGGFSGQLTVYGLTYGRLFKLMSVSF